MPEFLRLVPPEEARSRLLEHLSAPLSDFETVEVIHSLGRVAATDILAPHPLPEFPRSSVDGYEVRASDIFGASDSLPAYLTLIGEVPMGDSPSIEIKSGQCALIHTGGMLPAEADAVVMLEHTQQSQTKEIEVFKAVAAGENVIQVGEDVTQNSIVIPRGTILRPAEIGGLMGLGMTEVLVVRKVRLGLISTGDEIIDPSSKPRPCQVRDINSFSLGALIVEFGGLPLYYGIIRDQFESLKAAAERALRECDVIVITAGSSASTRDITAEVIRQLGEPGVLVHGINTRPGKPTILGVCRGKAVIGLPGNPVSALVNGYLFLRPVLEKLQNTLPRPRPTVAARLTINLASQAGREDWWPVKLRLIHEVVPSQYAAEPIFGKSNLIFTLAAADGLLCIPADATGLSAGEVVQVMLV